MKKFWGFFLLAIICASAGSLLFENPVVMRASATDDRISQIKNTNTTDIKVKVPAVVDMDDALKEKEEQIQTRERRLREQEELLVEQREKLKTQLDELLKVKDELQNLQAEKTKDEELRLVRMVKTFESMDVKKASGIVSIMEDELAVELLSRMKEKKAASLIAIMDPNRAMSLSSLLSTRKPASVKTGESDILKKKGGEKNE